MYYLMVDVLSELPKISGIPVAIPQGSFNISAVLGAGISVTGWNKREFTAWKLNN
jgi:hypothetical protein